MGKFFVSGRGERWTFLSLPVSANMSFFPAFFFLLSVLFSSYSTGCHRIFATAAHLPLSPSSHLSIPFTRNQWVKDVACRDERGAAITPFLELCYYDKTYPLGLNGTLLSPRNLEKKADRLPALRLTDIPDRGDKCTASWDSSVPVRCGSDKTRFLVAKLGARGLSDTESWPALDANNQTATTAIVELFQEGGEARVRCTPRWIRRDGTAPGVLGVKTLPASQSVLVTQSGELFFCFEVDERRGSPSKKFAYLPFLSLRTIMQPAPCTTAKPRSPSLAKPRTFTKTRLFLWHRSLSVTRSRQTPLRRRATNAICPASSRA